MVELAYNRDPNPFKSNLSQFPRSGYDPFPHRLALLTLLPRHPDPIPLLLLFFGRVEEVPWTRRRSIS